MTLRQKLLIWLARGRPVAMNLHLTSGLYIDGTRSMEGFYYRIHIDKKPDVEMPEDVGVHIYTVDQQPEEWRRHFES